MRNITKIMLLLQLSILSLWAGSVTAKVSDTEVVAGNRVELTIEAKGESIEFPTIDSVGNYPVEGTSHSSSMSYKMINGTTTKENIKSRVITFTPDKDMTIPSFEVEVDGVKLKTDPIDIKLVKSLAPTPTSGGKVTLTMTTNKDEVFVGEPVELQVFFSERRDAQLLKVEFGKPNFKDFLVKDMGDEKTYNKGNYTVHELRYILTPKDEGNFTIPSATANVAFRKRSRDDFFGTFFDRPDWKRVVSNTRTLKVKPAPQDTDLIGNFTIEDSVDAAKVKANKPVNLTLRISGEGNLEDFEGPKYEIDGVTIYSDDAKVSSQVVGGKLMSQYEKKFVFISDKDFTIPARSFTLFDTTTQKVKNLQMKAHTIKVTGGTATAAQVIQKSPPSTQREQTKPSPKTTQKEQSKPKAQALTADSEDRVAQAPKESTLALWMLALAFAIGVIVTLGAIKIVPTLNLKKSMGIVSDEEALKILYPHINSDAKVEEMVRKLYAKKGGDKSVVIDKVQLKAMVEHYANHASFHPFKSTI